ncbi:hypothetical protein F4553_008041 [Allocatelliglobosispora scoriae]|uniref:Uncharacterized protein n=1 Tax=Allocatelliglobosispora scoriae TaxID=643052 RepID=A0A841BZL9_9ACTN|nr:hypothetical protein [Allocatelliglobosispora scoriae]MBB5874607.1 hypothetical protein [Allocatelliglobosispora scoriae]
MLTDSDKLTIQTAAHGALALMIAADPGVISSTKAGVAGGEAMGSATGLVGHVLSEKLQGLTLKGNSVAEIADTVFPALGESVKLLDEKAPGEADNFRRTITVIVESASQAAGGSPAETEMLNKITAAMSA